MTALRTTPVEKPAAASSPDGYVVVTHAYGEHGSCDPLHVDLSIQLIREALGPKPEILIHAANDAPANDHGSVIGAPGFSGSIFDKLAGCTRIAAGLSGEKYVFRGGFPKLEEVQPSLIVGCGGGYLRTSNNRETVRTTLAHLPQVLWATNQPVPSIYLPQSIGPLGTRSGRRLRDAIERIDHLFVRDDRTASLFLHHDGLRRAPDLAVMDFVRRLPENLNDAGREKLYLAVDKIPNHLRNTDGLVDRLSKLHDLLPDVEVLRGNDSKSNKSLQQVWDKLGWEKPERTIDDALRQGPSGVMISISLEGALGAMLAGWPAVHLATQRKGFGAFADLNLSGFIHKATCFDPNEVANIATSLRFGRIGFWDGVETARATCEAERTYMTDLIGLSYIKGQNRRRALA